MQRSDALQKFAAPKLTSRPRRYFALVSVLVLGFGQMIAAAHAERAAGQRRGLSAEPFILSDLTSLSGNYLAARAAILAQDVNEAARFYDNAYRLDPDNRELLARAFLLYLTAGDVGRAAELASRIQKYDAKDRLSRLVLAVREIRHQRYTAARDLLLHESKESGATEGDVDITAGLLAAWATQGTGATDQAMAVLGRLKGADWYEIFRNYHGGLISDLAARRLETAKKPEELAKWRNEANERLAAAYKADPYALRIMEAQARALVRAGNQQQALGVLRDFLGKAPENPLAKSLFETIEAKRPVAPMLRDVRQGAAEVLLGLGSALARDDGQDIATIYLNLATYIDSENGLALLSLADLMDQSKRTERAIALYERVPRNSPMRRAADLQEALALDDLNRTEDALSALDRVLKLNTKDIDAWTTRGNILRAKKRFGEAARAYDAALAEIKNPQPRHWALLFFRGICFEREKQWDLAERDLKRALELQPERPEVLNYLGYSWVDRHRNLPEALGMLHRAVELRPDDGYIIDSVGWAYYRLGNYDEALKWMEKAVEKKPGDPVINDHLGDVFYRLGRTLEARFQWSHARDLSPEPEDLALIAEKLRTGELPKTAEPASSGQNAQPAKEQGG